MRGTVNMRQLVGLTALTVAGDYLVGITVGNWWAFLVAVWGVAFMAWLGMRHGART